MLCSVKRRMPSVNPESRPRAIIGLIDDLALTLENSRIWPFAIFLAFYLPITALIASRKLLWDDEFFTLYLSRPSSMTDSLKALGTGADQHPPPFYFLIHLITAALGPSHLTLRLTAIFGYGLFCVCLFFLLRNRTSVLWATLGMLLPLVANPAYYYATEARGYSSMLGFCSLALLSWQRAIALEKRFIWLCVLFCALAMAVASHYYAILFLIPLCLGELVRTYQLKRIDIGIWLSFCGAFVFPIVFLSTIRHASQYSTHFWAIPYWRNILEFYPAFLGTSTTIFLLAVFVCLVSPSSPRDNERGMVQSSPMICEIVTWAGIAAIPIFGMVLAKFVTHGYTERYAISALIGAFLIVSYAGFQFAGRSRIVPLVLIVSCLLLFGIQGMLSLRTHSMDLNALLNNASTLAPHTTQPIVISDVTVFHRLSFYTPRTFTRTLVYLSDPATSFKYIGQDTIDRGMLDLRPWFPLNVAERARYVEEHSLFLAFGTVGGWDWITHFFTPPNYKTELLARDGDKLLLSIQRIAPVSESAQAGLHRTDSEPLFKHIRATGPSLCQDWFRGDSLCVTIEQKLNKQLARTP
jgi:hypothetical protein